MTNHERYTVLNTFIEIGASGYVIKEELDAMLASKNNPTKEDYQKFDTMLRKCVTNLVNHAKQVELYSNLIEYRDDG